MAVCLVGYSELKMDVEGTQTKGQKDKAIDDDALVYLRPRDDSDKLYMSRKEGERGLTSIEDSVNMSIRVQH